MSKRDEFLGELAALARELIPTIGDEYRASDDPFDDTPGMQVTIGVNAKGWNYQTGDNSFVGGAYGYAHWGVGSLYRDTDPAEFARDILQDLENQTDEENCFFFDAPEISCNQCEMLSINGVACHETGCPNAHSRWDAESGDWIKQRVCRECGQTVDADDLCCDAPCEG